MECCEVLVVRVDYLEVGFQGFQVVRMVELLGLLGFVDYIREERGDWEVLGCGVVWFSLLNGFQVVRMVELLGLLGFLDYIRGQGGLVSLGAWRDYFLLNKRFYYQ